jgi:hypothetical protein
MVALPFDIVPRRWPLAPLALLLACGPQVELETDTTDGTGDPTGSMSNVTASGATDPTAATTIDPDGGTEGPIPTERQVDIVFVVDNSGSMGEEQAKLVGSIESLVAALDGAVPPVDYRIGVTTTDNGNPWCGTTGPEAGKLRATSCRSRQTEFVFNGAITVDVTQEACLDVCALDSLGIGEPWIQVDNSVGTTNVSGDVLENLRCMLPQGIDGCGFESQLESLWKSIRRFETASDEDFGFHRAGALLTAIIVTDEVDCSYNSEYETLFLPDGNRVFWSDSTAASPTSAVCWNAGVACDGDQCSSVNLDIDGNEVADGDAADQAVLHPLERYTTQLLERAAYVVALYGVNSDGSVTYQPSLMDPQYQNDFGIGPGCESADGHAVPPVRMRELISTVSGEGINGRSICDADYAPTMTSFAQGIVDRLP